MRDPVTFERRLADALEQYALAAPTDIDSATLALDLAGRGRDGAFPGLQWPARGIRLVLVAALLGVALVAGLLAVGMKQSDPFDASDRILVWLPRGGGGGATYLFDPSGTLRWSGEQFSDGCPTLLPGSGVVLRGSGGPRGTSALRIETDDGQPVEAIEVEPGTNAYWAPDHSAVALIGFDSGRTTVVQFGHRSTTYGQDGSLAGVLDAAVMNGGGRVVVAVRTDAGVDVHLIDGRDTVIYRLEPFDAQVVDPELVLAPDGSRVAMVWANTEGRFPEPHVVVISLPDGAAVETRPEVVPSLDYHPLSWSPDSSQLALVYGSRIHLYDAASRVWRDSGWASSRFRNASRWRDEPGAGLGIATFDGSALDVHREGVATGKRVPIAGSTGAFSPDGTQFAFLEGAGMEDVQAGRPTRVWAVDIWGDEPTHLIATLPADRPPYISEPCIDWQRGGAP
jgi:hypothetical protein